MTRGVNQGRLVTVLDGLEARAEADPTDVYLAQLVRFARAIQAQHPDAYAQAMIESTGERARPADHPRATDPDQGDWLMAINTTPPTAHDYERTIHQYRQHIEQLEAVVEAVLAAADRWAAPGHRGGCCCMANSREIRDLLDITEHLDTEKDGLS